MTGTTRIAFNRMEYVLTENNYDEWHKDFILELQDLGLCEYVEKNIEDIIKEVKEKYTNKDKRKMISYLKKVKIKLRNIK